MKDFKMQLRILPHTPFLNKNGSFDKAKAISYSAKLAGECYEPDGYEKLQHEPFEKTQRREQFTLGLEHSTPYEHVNIGFELINIPKILAMVLNNERQCSTSEKLARYTQIDAKVDPAISELEGKLYKKWIEIFKIKIKKEYGHIFNESKIEKLAQENARYLVTVFASTKMIHTLPWVQLNRIVSFMIEYIRNSKGKDLDDRLIPAFVEFIFLCESNNLLDARAMSNRKHRSLSLFADTAFPDDFGYSYTTSYEGTFAQLAQAHRHRTLEYSMLLQTDKEYFIPPIIADDQALVEEWLSDMASVAGVNPQGEKVLINETGSYKNFILKAKERLCTSAQQEIMVQTKQTLNKMEASFKLSKHPLYSDIVKYKNGARCTFPDYDCAQDCNFKEGKKLTRRL